MKKAQQTELREITHHAPAKVDREAAVIRGVKILGRASRNGYEYSDAALRQAAGLQEGAKVHVDHPPLNSPSDERSVTTFFGQIRNVETKADGNYGDLHYLKSHPLAESVLERAERFPATFGLSQNARGEKRQCRDRTIVESVTLLRSVDLVDRPATTDGLYESHRESEPMPTTLKEFVAAIPKGTAGLDGLTSLVETDEYGGLAMAADAGGSSAESQVKAAFRAMIVAAVDDESLDIKATVAKIKQLLAAQEKLLTGKTTSEGETETAESLRREVETLRATIACRDLLETAGVTATPVRVKALAALAENDRQSLVESWQDSRPSPASKPASSPPKEVAAWKDHDEFIRRVKR